MPRPVYEVKAELFRTLAHPLRIRILEVLRHGETGVTEIAEEVGVGGSTLSQHLAILRRADILASRREGSTVLYTVVDPRVFELLEVARKLLTTSLEGTKQTLADLERLSFD